MSASSGGGSSYEPYPVVKSFPLVEVHEKDLPTNVEIEAEHVFQALGLKQEITKDYLVKMLKCAGLFDKKQHDYGPDNIAQFGDLGVLIRLNDKIQRLRTLYMSGEQPEFTDEAFADTWMDIHVYGVIGWMCLDGTWPKAYRHMER